MLYLLDCTTTAAIPYKNQVIKKNTGYLNDNGFVTLSERRRIEEFSSNKHQNLHPGFHLVLRKYSTIASKNNQSKSLAGTISIESKILTITCVLSHKAQISLFIVYSIRLY